MQAFVRTGAKDQQIKLVEMPIPEIDENEVLVKVQAFGVGLQERYFIPQNALFPYIIGTEASGVIIKTGSYVTRFKVEDQVILTSVLQPKGGCWAEYVAVPQNSLIPLPSKMNFVEGAAIPIAGKTALESMRALNLKSGDTLFIAGASGAIGTLVIQLASTQGIIVIGSASQKNHPYMLSLGAQKVVDYSDSNWTRHLKRWIPEGMTAALAIQPGTVEDSMALVKDGGKVITVSGDDQVKPKRDVSVRQIQHHTDTKEALITLISDISAGRIRLVIERIYPFPQALDALKKTETRHARGKIVVSV